MYRSFTAADYQKHLNLSDNYKVDGFIIFGTFRSTPYKQLKEAIDELGLNAEYKSVLPKTSSYYEFLKPITEFIVDGKTYWFVVAYGGTMLSEWLHLACLFGSQKNIVIGSCGGLLKEADTPDIIVPTLAYANESTTRMYEPTAHCKHTANKALSERLIRRLQAEHKVWHGPTVTCQAMMAETWDDVLGWSDEGYYGVEMEAATVFAISNHFKRQSAALLVIGDNLVAEKTVLDVNYEEGGRRREQARGDMLKAALIDFTENA